jgi:hypothetical protein
VAVALVLMTADASHAISGLATPGNAVSAQYPDQQAPGKNGTEAGKVPTLLAFGPLDLMSPSPAVRRQARRMLARERTALAVRVPRELTAASRPAGPGPVGDGPIPLLTSAMVVMGVGVLLRWRRRTMTLSW